MAGFEAFWAGAHSAGAQEDSQTHSCRWYAYASVGADFAPALLRYARYLGIDPVADHDLLWIAVEAGPKMPS